MGLIKIFYTFFFIALITEYFIYILCCMHFISRLTKLEGGVTNYRYSYQESSLSMCAVTLFLAFSAIFFAGSLELCFFSWVCINVFFFLYKAHRFVLLEEAWLFLVVMGCGVILIFEDWLPYIYLYMEGVNLCTIFIIVLSRGIGSIEAAVKYFLFSLLASVFFLLAMYLIYVTVGVLYLSEVAILLSISPSEFNIIMLLVMVSCMLKLGIVPFHGFLMDVYAVLKIHQLVYMLSLNKMFFFVLLIKFLGLFYFVKFLNLIAFLGFLTIVVGLIGSLYQTRLNLFLGYTGFISTGSIFVVLGGFLKGNLVYILFFYALYVSLVVLFLFMCMDFFSNSQNFNVEMRVFNSLFYIKPGIASLVALFLFSLIGIPPLIGFIYKLIPFTFAFLMGALCVGAFSLLVGIFAAFYYLRIVVILYWEEIVGYVRKWSLLISLEDKGMWFQIFLFIFFNICFIWVILGLVEEGYLICFFVYSIIVIPQF